MKQPQINIIGRKFESSSGIKFEIISKQDKCYVIANMETGETNNYSIENTLRQLKIGEIK